LKNCKGFPDFQMSRNSHPVFHRHDCLNASGRLHSGNHHPKTKTKKGSTGMTGKLQLIILPPGAPRFSHRILRPVFLQLVHYDLFYIQFVMGGQEEGGVEDICQEERFSRANEFAGYCSANTKRKAMMLLGSAGCQPRRYDTRQIPGSPRETVERSLPTWSASHLAILFSKKEGLFIKY
jgi:hypothetical protein